MTKRDIAQRIFEKQREDLGLSKGKVYDIVCETISIIEEALKKEEKVQITGFGTFKIKTRKKKKGRNLKTGEEVEVPERKVVLFKPSLKLLSLLESQSKKG